jgi:transposase-like protein
LNEHCKGKPNARATLRTRSVVRVARRRQCDVGERHLSKNAVSRIVTRLKALFTTWRDRDLSIERYPIIFFDGFHLKVRLAWRVVSIPVLAALGVAEMVRNACSISASRPRRRR